MIINYADQGWPIPIKRRGLYKSQASLKSLNWFGTGGKADLVYIPADLEDLVDFIGDIPASLPLYMLGAGSNTLARDGGFRGVILRLGSAFAFMKLEVASGQIRVGAAASDRKLAEFAALNGIGGLEFLYTIPGTIGGAIAMNAGAYGSDISKVLVSVKAINRNNGIIKEFTNAELLYSYRKSHLAKEWLFIEALLQGSEAKPELIMQNMENMQSKRLLAQPVGVKTGGSTFINPQASQYKAWELIEAVGLRGYSCGGAMFSEKHCNFIINFATASSDDIEFLIETAKIKVKQKFDIDLKEEIILIGQKPRYSHDIRI